jgi:hypothetical protein
MQPNGRDDGKSEVYTLGIRVCTSSAMAPQSWVRPRLLWSSSRGDNLGSYSPCLPNLSDTRPPRARRKLHVLSYPPVPADCGRLGYIVGM